MTAPVAIGIMVCAPQAPKLVDRFGTKQVVVGGLLVVVFALCLYMSDTIMSSVVARRHRARRCSASGMGFTVAPATESIMGSLPPAKAGVGSAVNDTTRQTGGALGVAVIGSIFAVALPPRGRFGDAGAGVSATGGAGLHRRRARRGPQPAGVGSSRRSHLRDHAYLVSMRPAYGLAAIVVLLAAAVTWRYLPAHAPDEGEAEEEAAELLAEPVPVTTG